MSNSLRIKIILLAIPVLVLLYVFLVRDRLGSPSIGGGSYDLTNMFTLLGVGGYLLIYNIVLLTLGARQNIILLAIGVLTLLTVMLMAAKSW